MHKVGLLFLVLLATSCQLFDKKVPDENQLLQQELQKINWEEVDELPSVMQCDTIKDIAVKKQCFFDYLAQTIQERIKRFPKTNNSIGSVIIKISTFRQRYNYIIGKIINTFLSFHLVFALFLPHGVFRIVY